MIIALIGLKGGTGKTTLGIGIACEAMQRGRRVLCLDTDPCGPVAYWAQRSADDSVPTVLGMSGSALEDPSHLRALALGYDLTVVDCPSGSIRTSLNVLAAADLALIPCGPSPLDVWSLTDSFALVTRARLTNPGLHAATVINRADPRTLLGETLPGDLRRCGVPTLSSHVGRRVLHAESIAAGASVTTYAPRSAAAAEVRELVDEVEALTPRCSADAHVQH